MTRRTVLVFAVVVSLFTAALTGLVSAPPPCFLPGKAIEHDEVMIAPTANP